MKSYFSPNIQQKIVLLLSIVGAIFIAGAFYQINSNGARLGLLLRDIQEKEKVSFVSLLEERAKTMDGFVRDYTFWDEMVEFISSHDEMFAEENIDTGAETFGADLVQVYDLGQNLVYKTSSEETLAEPVSIPAGVFERLNEKRFMSFFISTQAGVMRLRGATIHPTDDPDRETEPRGYFFAGKIWGDEYLQSLAETTGSEATLVLGSVPPEGSSRIDASAGEIYFNVPLNDWKGEPIAYLVVKASSPGIAQYTNSSFLQLIIFASFILSLLLLLYFVLVWLVANPIRVLSRSISEKDIRPMEKMKNERSEFGALAGLVLKFSEHEQVVADKAYDDALLSAVGSGLVAVDQDGKIVLINKSGADMLGLDPEKVKGKKVDEVLHMQDEKGNDIPTDSWPLSVALKTGASNFGEFQIVPNERKPFPVIASVAPVLIAGEATGAIMDFTDITKERDIDRAKTEFISIASHQLRTPTTYINWYSELLLKQKIGTLNDRQMSYVRAIHSGNKRMIELMNSLLIISRIELGSLIANPEPLNLPNFLDEVVGEMQAQIDEKKVSMVKQYDPVIRDIRADASLLHIIMDNLLSNAVTYVPGDAKGRIEIKTEDAGGQVKITVSDNGYGIPLEDQKNLFKRFFRAKNARTIKPEGNGLGLYITKYIVEYLGGTIGFTSEEGKGTSFLVMLPISKNG